MSLNQLDSLIEDIVINSNNSSFISEIAKDLKNAHRLCHVKNNQSATYANKRANYFEEKLIEQIINEISTKFIKTPEGAVVKAAELNKKGEKAREERFNSSDPVRRHDLLRRAITLFTGANRLSQKEIIGNEILDRGEQ